MKRAFINAVEAVLPEPFVAFFAIMRRHKRNVGVFPNLLRPTTFNEKLLHRMLFDRRPLWTRLQDKYSAREYVKARIGEEVLPRLFWVTEDPADIPFDDLPRKFVVKPSHASGWVVLVPDRAEMNRRDLIETCRAWLRENYYYHYREWHYKNIVPRIMVEEYISDGTGPVPTDYKLHVFGGRVEVVSVMHGRFQDMRSDLYLRPPDATRRLRNLRGLNNAEQDLNPPRHLATMIEYAEALGRGLDYVRVDLYDTPDKVYFGELTPTPSAGTEPFEPRDLDRLLGRLWATS